LSTQRSVVSIERCTDYHYPRVNQAVKNAVDALGGMNNFVKPGQKVLLKTNFLTALPPERAATTHPAVVKAVIELAQEAGGIVSIGDSPALSSALTVARKSGNLKVAREMGVPVINFEDPVEVPVSEGKIFRKIEVAQEAIDADVVINLPKLKTHDLLPLTLAVKNIFGCVVGRNKARWHVQAGHDVSYFARMLAELCALVNPAINIMDGIVGMEGNGPRNGDPRQIGLILASPDAVALDRVVQEVLGLRQEELITTVVGGEIGLGENDLYRIECRGERSEEVKIDGFNIPIRTQQKQILGKTLRWLFKDSFTYRPVINHRLCSRCGICLEACPLNIISYKPSAREGKEKLVQIDYQRCIHCFCCQENCTEGAISGRPGWLGNVLNRLGLS
jgi:uncharacterized protein (DUF362 family)/NAD-dependent dihydropyrimidine dehydrogenase PreA subunit